MKLFVVKFIRRLMGFIKYLKCSMRYRIYTWIKNKSPALLSRTSIIYTVLLILYISSKNYLIAIAEISTLTYFGRLATSTVSLAGAVASSKYEP